MKFNTGKCEVLQLGWSNLKDKHRLSDGIESSWGGLEGQKNK